MKDARSLLAVPALLLLVACGSTSNTANAWSNASLDDTRRQQETDRCTMQSKAVEDDYNTRNSRIGTNSSTSLINNLKVRQTAMRMRNESFAECMQAAGFTRQQ